jgi:putative transposase
MVCHAHGMNTSEIQGHLEEIYGVEVSPELISTVTDGVMEEVRAGRGWPLERTSVILYPHNKLINRNQEAYALLG